ncbi:MAG: deoxyguanosinetriphosphate triphosphohydrolase [Actinomycetota bacterium]|nr:deoxyguanosinetriphosphate triphosphohydrolase [Actinomycetota bacterium]MDI6821449.1 deoxyguanosinetriphosphate triphosphohydrolase [Actinomycetota bacterium]
MNIRERIEKEEKRLLSPRAQLSVNSKGRKFPEEPCSLRTCFQRDRDRIVHCKSFRRLSHKTQVFLAPEGDHYRTRLTHTLEVSQISRTIARSLKLNEDLTEAIALGHDLGHTPFGHIGEEALTECLCQVKDENPELYPSLPCAFRHNEQSLRVVDFIEYGGKGLNLTWEVRDGILHHTGDESPSTLEGQIVGIADRIAYINHDIDDAIRGGILSQRDLPQGPLEILGKYHGIRINTMVMDMIRSSAPACRQTRGEGRIQMSPIFAEAMENLRNFLMQRVYMDSPAKMEDEKAKRVLKTLFFYYLKDPRKLPPEFYTQTEEELPIKVCDYVAGMTDRYALRTYEQLFVPKAWMI